MKNNQVGIDFLKIFAFYGVYWALIYLMIEYELPGSLGVIFSKDNQPVAFSRVSDDLNEWLLVVMGASLVCCLFWYALGEWGLKPYSTKHSTWVLLWVALLAVVLIAGSLAAWMGPQPSDNNGSLILALLYFLGGAGFYYIATVFSSPVNTKFVVPGSKLLRR
jgi:hypothetical protein